MSCTWAWSAIWAPGGATVMSQLSVPPHTTLIADVPSGPTTPVSSLGWNWSSPGRSGTGVGQRRAAGRVGGCDLRLGDDPGAGAAGRVELDDLAVAQGRRVHRAAEGGGATRRGVGRGRRGHRAPRGRRVTAAPVRAEDERRNQRGGDVTTTEKSVANAAMIDVNGNPLACARPQAFDTVEEERAHRKAKLAAAFRMFSKAGLDEGVAGHITVRDPEYPDTFWVNPYGRHFSMIRSSDLIRVDEDGEVVEGDWAGNRAAVAIHCAVHAARPDGLAAAHAHGPYGKT